MKSNGVKPLRAYRAPSYPTGAEIGRVDLSRVPARWQGLKAVASTLGAAAMSLKALALEAQEAPKPVPAAPVVAEPDAEASKAVAQEPATEVCPLPAKEIAGDGAGAFGCVAMNPPVILPEGEALDIIEKEFAKRGLTLVDCPVVEGADAPKKGWLKTLDVAELYRVLNRQRVGELPDVPRERRRVMLDFATPDGAIAVEYVSNDDADEWIENMDCHSTVRCVRTRLGAEEMVRTLQTRTHGKPLKVGIFYDPCAYLPDDWKPAYPEGMKPRDPEAWEIACQQRKAARRALAREKLIAQIEHFFKYLEKHPVK